MARFAMTLQDYNFSNETFTHLGDTKGEGFDSYVLLSR